jgi:hypothetical protein
MTYEITAWNTLCALFFLLSLFRAHGQGDCGLSGTLSISDPAACGCGGSCYPSYCSPLGTGNCNRQLVSAFLDIPPCYNGTIRAQTLNCNPNASGLDIGDFCQVGFTRIDGNNNLLVNIEECHAAPSGTTIPVAITLSADRKDEIISYSLSCTEHNAGCGGGLPPCSLILPLSISDFSIKAGDQVQLTWSIHNLSSIEYLRVLRSIDGFSWAELKSIQPHNLVLFPEINQCIDNQPLPGNNYYKIEETDHTGRTFYSQILFYLNQNRSFSINKVGPNPCATTIEVALTAENGGDIECFLLDHLGTTVLNHCLTIPEGSSFLQLNLNAIKSGNYNIVILHKGRMYNWPIVKL